MTRLETIDRLADVPTLGALEIVAFAGIPANDNGAAVRGQARARRRETWALPTVAFIGGVTVALAVVSLSHMLGISA